MTDLMTDDFASVTGLLCGGFGGTVHLPGDEQYDVQRRPLDPNLDPKPAVVVEAHRREDVQSAVRVARQAGLPFAVQATGHGTRLPSDGGVLLKTGGMASVLVDPQRRVAKVGPGARWGEVIDAAKPFGLAPLAGSSRDVGVTGYTLGGGIGWLARKYGFAADSVIRAEVVTATGAVVVCSAKVRPDLFWAIRGGSGNFGVVTSLEFQLYPVASVYAGIAYFGIDRAKETLELYRTWSRQIPDELSTAITLTNRPDGTRAMAIKVMYAGEASAAEEILKPLLEVAGPVREGGYRQMAFGDAQMGGTASRHLDLLNELPDEKGFDVLLELDATVEIRHWGGAMNQGETPVGHRQAQYSLIIDKVVPGLPSTGRTFLNFLSDPARTASSFTEENYKRLREVKRAYDPDNFFRLNHNIPPA
ncbi:FAD-binding oxidoreductase [Kribbella deserti]|uniref:FAD-binding oxidoreductase n=1 Tax=Kribbella deserti TaxID=1926257 RepID=A0ABV6QXP2_9ACTN